MFPTFVNAFAIIAGSIIGILTRKGFSEKMQETVYTAAGFVTAVIGIQMVLKTSHILALALSVILGGIAGTLMDIEGSILKLGDVLKRRFAKNEENKSFAFGFLNATVLFCVGPMAILGSFQAGTEGSYDILYTKSLLDGFIAIMFAGAMGAGVAFSSIAVFIYQGALTLVSVQVKPWVSPVMLAELSGVGGVLILMIAVNLLRLKTIRTGDFLPSVIFMACFVPLFQYVSFL